MNRVTYFICSFFLFWSTIVCAQIPGPLTTQGAPPFSLQSNAGGGIDSINLGNLDILLSIPINSNGVYGPQSSATMRMESGFPLVKFSGQVMIGAGGENLFSLHAPVASPYSLWVGPSGCTGGFSNAVDSTGAFHDVPAVQMSACNTLYVSQPGRDGWQVAAYLLPPIGSYYEVIAPDGTYTTQSFVVTDGTFVSLTFDLHGNYTNYTNYTGTGAQWWADAASNLTATTVGYGFPASQIDYPGPGGTTDHYFPSWSSLNINTDANCSAYHQSYQTQASLPTSASFLSSLTLPDGSQYQFTYETYWNNPATYTGRIASVTLPTGAVITYTYSGGTNNQGVWCDDGSTATISKTTPDGTWVFTHCEYGLAVAPSTCNTSPPNGWTGNHLATTTVTAPSGDYKIYTTGSYIPSDPAAKVTLPIQEQAFGVTGPGCSVASPCNLGGQIICYYPNLTYPACAVPPGVGADVITERDVYTLVPGVPNPALTTYLLDTHERTTEVRVYDFGGSRTGINWDSHTLTTYGSWNGSICAPVTFNSFQVMDRVCSKQVFVGGGGTPVSTSYFTYNQYADLVTVQNTIGGVLVTTASNQYDSKGRLLSSSGPNGEHTATAYNACSGQEPSSTTVTIGTGASLTTNYITYDCTGERLLTKQDANGNNWTTNYTGDPFWRPISTTDPLQNTTYYTYTPTTRDTKLTVASGSTEETLAQVDSMGRSKLSQVKLNGTSNYSIRETDFDSNGRVRRVTLPYTAAAGTLNSTVGAFTYTYDGIDRVLTEAGPPYSSSVAGTTKTYAYNANDTLVTVSPPPSGENSKSTQTEVNGLGEVTSVCEVTSTSFTGSAPCNQSSPVNGLLTTYSYYPGGKLSAITQNALGTTTQQRSFTYDNSNTGRTLTATTPESGRNTTVYDSDPNHLCSSFIGFPVKTIDNAGGTACISYDLADRVITMTYPAGLNSSNTPPKTFVYDSTGNTNINCGSAGNQKGAIAEAFTGTSGNKITDEGFCYDLDGRATDSFLWTSTGNSAYTHINESYFPDGQVNTLSIPTFPTITYSLDANGRVYSATSVLKSVTYWDPGLPKVVTFGSGDISTYTPFLNLEPHIAAHTIGSGTTNTISHTVTWNSNGSLASLATSDQINPANTQTCAFSYDDLERALTNNCGSNWNENYSYDVFGNVTKTGSAPWPVSGGYSQSNNRYTSSVFAYDANGRLTNDTFDSLGWDVNGNLISQSGTNLVYDAFDRPVAGGTTQYLYAADGTLVGTEASNGSITKAFVPLPMGRAVYASGVLHYDRYDWQGSARVASTAARTVYSDTSYDAFGIPYWSSGTANNQYAGLNSDISSGGEQVSATRRYHPVQGRWISPDSVVPDIYNPQTFNAYHYALNQPTNTTDPGGECEGDDPSACTLTLLGGSQITLPRDVTVNFFGITGCNCDAFNGYYSLYNPETKTLYPQEPAWMVTLLETPVLVPQYESGGNFGSGGFPPIQWEYKYPSRMTEDEVEKMAGAEGALAGIQIGSAFGSGLSGGLEAGVDLQVTEFTAPGISNTESALLQPYRPYGGHHIPAQSAFRGAANYDANAAPAIPNSELVRLNLDHLRVITPTQRFLYTEFAKTGNPLTWDAVQRIETQALIRAGMKPTMAQNTVQQAIQQLKQMGVSGPTRIPWGD
jgi:RHS repeat-associated protein